MDDEGGAVLGGAGECSSLALLRSWRSYFALCEERTNMLVLGWLCPKMGLVE